MAAQTKSITCSRCFASVSEKDTVCPECGAPLKSDMPLPGADSAMHHDLAQANLMRVRGDLDLAEKQCLGILKRYPNEPEAHSLLGELSADKGDIPRAIEWYELALDLNPNSTKDQERLNELKEKLNHADTAHIEEQLSIADKPNYWLYGMAGVIVLVLLALFVYTSMHGPAQKPVGPGQLNRTVVAEKETPDDQTQTAGVQDNRTAPAPDAGNTASDQQTSAQMPLAMEDRTLMQLLQQRSVAGAAISSVEQDPRDKALIITYEANNPEDARRTGALLAKDALTYSTDSLLVTVRAISGGRLTFVADASRPKLSDLETSGVNTSDPSNDAWIASFLQREWASTTPNGTAATTGQTGENPAGGPNANPTPGAANTTGASPTTGGTSANSVGSPQATGTESAGSASTSH